MNLALYVYVDVHAKAFQISNCHLLNFYMHIYIHCIQSICFCETLFSGNVVHNILQYVLYIVNTYKAVHKILCLNLFVCHMHIKIRRQTVPNLLRLFIVDPASVCWDSSAEPGPGLTLRVSLTGLAALLNVLVPVRNFKVINMYLFSVIFHFTVVKLRILIWKGVQINK